MGLDVSLIEDGEEVFSAYVTHNLNKMADEAGIYKCIWRPEEIGAKVAGDIIETLREGLIRLASHPREMEKFNPPNGWGSWEKFVPWVGRYLEACVESPNARIEVSR